jgi:hypothetical protein
MRERELKEWLSQPRTALVQAVADGVREHVAQLRSQDVDFYGYALAPGEPPDVRSIVVVTNTEADIKLPRSDDMYRYYRYSVDEWANWEHGGFAAANALLAESNRQFASLHSKPAGDCMPDEFDNAYGEALLHAVLDGLEIAKSGNAFGDKMPFLAIWISDSDHKIIFESVRRLNPTTVANEFLREFG